MVALSQDQVDKSLSASSLVFHCYVAGCRQLKKDSRMAKATEQQ